MAGMPMTESQPVEIPPQSNVFTLLLFIAVLFLSAGSGLLLVKANDLYGGVMGTVAQDELRSDIAKIQANVAAGAVTP